MMSLATVVDEFMKSDIIGVEVIGYDRTMSYQTKKKYITKYPDLAIKQFNGKLYLINTAKVSTRSVGS